MISEKIEYYKCFILTVIVLLLLALLFKTSIPATRNSLRRKIIRTQDIPLVYVHGGSLEVSGSVAIES